MVRRHALQPADRHRLAVDALAPAGRLARPVAGAAEDAGEHVRLAVHHVGVGEPPLRDQPDVFRNVGVGRAGPLAVDDAVEVVGIANVGGAHRPDYRSSGRIAASQRNGGVIRRFCELRGAQVRFEGSAGSIGRPRGPTGRPSAESVRDLNPEPCLGPPSVSAETVEHAARAHVDPPVRDRRRRVDVVVHVVDRDRVERAVGRQNGDLALLGGEEDLAVGGDRRGVELIRRPLDAALGDRLPGAGRSVVTMPPSLTM